MSNLLTKSKIYFLKCSIRKRKIFVKNLGYYILVSDNFIKMARILLNIEAKTPVILFGETGV